MRKHCAVNAPKARRSGEKTLNAAFPPNKTGDQIAQICAVAEGGLCFAAQKQQGPADTLHFYLFSPRSSTKRPSALAMLTISQLPPADNSSLGHEVGLTQFRLA